MDERAKSSSQGTGSVPPRRSAWAQTFESLRYRDFRLLWFSTLCVAGGTWLMQVTLGWLAYEMTGSPLQVSIILGLRAAPLLLAPVTGVLADRFDRRRLLLIDQAFVTAVVLGFAALLLMDQLLIWHMYAFALLFGLGWAVNNPVRQTLVATCVPRESLTNAVAIISIAFNSMRAVGPAIGGVMIMFFGPGLNFLIIGILFFLILLLLLPFRARYGGADRGTALANSPFHNLKEGFRYVLSEPLILTTVGVTFAISMTMMSLIYSQLPVYAAEVLLDEEGGVLGLLMAGLGIGGLIGTLLMARFGYVQRKGLLASIAFAGAGVGMLAMSQIELLLPALLVLIAIQGFFQAVMTMNQTIVQTITPDAMRGRVTGVFQMEIGMMTLGGVIVGAIADVWGIQTALVVSAVCGLAVLALVTVLVPRYWNLRL